MKDNIRVSGRLPKLAVLSPAVLMLAVLGILGGCGNVPGLSTAPPSGFLLSAPTNSSVVDGAPPTLIWTDSTGETRYYVEYGKDPVFSLIDTAIIAANATSYTIPASKLEGNKKYYWRVLAINSSGRTAASNWPFSFTTTTVPIVDFSLKSPVNGATIAAAPPTLEWTDGGNESGYLVHISTLPTFSTLYYTATVSANTTSYVHTDLSYSLASGMTYYWEVLATFSSGSNSVVATNAPFSFVMP